ncbi:hypothetical protein GGTG_03536 [Gaeumannomyces tritici R3-111a-1]|uniref:Uncharacterized protein n=1 Tax=Gaeumannomyces tritici (strain R3-111a-1) TaxID=644352 RepID=J3NQH9_GAET3|nr:hypothetical protein GGTG_03536 [Gaeumannomyces tritici R3-111a-1]EJT78435.1 hypothetical protein GGTG_03536 [Gaeumannomyces tritici R3-111a-1]
MAGAAGPALDPYACFGASFLFCWGHCVEYTAFGRHILSFMRVSSPRGSRSAKGPGPRDDLIGPAQWWDWGRVGGGANLTSILSAANH